jgi:hypothetical protein
VHPLLGTEETPLCSTPNARYEAWSLDRIGSSAWRIDAQFALAVTLRDELAATAAVERAGKRDAEGVSMG